MCTRVPVCLIVTPSQCSYGASLNGVLLLTYQTTYQLRKKWSGFIRTCLNRLNILLLCLSLQISIYHSLAHVSGLSLLLLVQSFFPSFLACLLVLSTQCELLEMLLLFYKDYEFSADKLVEKMKLCLVWLTAYTYHVLNWSSIEHIPCVHWALSVDYVLQYCVIVHVILWVDSLLPLLLSYSGSFLDSSLMAVPLLSHRIVICLHMSGQKSLVWCSL